MPYQRRTFESRIDYSLILPVLMLLSIGVVAIYIAVSHDYPDNAWPMFGQQIAWIAVVLPLIFYSQSLVASTGAKNWIAIRGVTLFQPSEFMKISYILMLSRLVVHFLQQHKQDERTLALDFFLILKLGLYTVPVLVLLTLQSDLGTALVFVAIYGAGLSDGSPAIGRISLYLYFRWRPCFSA